MHITVDPEFQNLIPPLMPAERDGLEKSLIEHGCRDPLVLWKNTLLDGHHRYEICQRLGITFEVVNYSFDSRTDAMLWVLDNQESRRNLTAYQRGVLQLKRKPLLAAQAKERMLAGKGADPVENLPQGKTRDIAAEPVGISGRTLDKIEYLEEHADAETKEQLARPKRAGGVSVDAAYRATRSAEQDAKNAAIKANAPPPPPDTYEVVVIDPPWPMKKIERDCRPNQTAAIDYPTMDEDALADLKIPASDDCHVFLWTTHRFLPMAFRLLECWDFRYVCTFVWHKPGGFQPVGLPQYNCEFVLYARKGTPKFVDTKAFPACFAAPRGKHSEKPGEFYEVLARVADGRRIDMFSRRAIDGFDAWGNEAP